MYVCRSLFIYLLSQLYNHPSHKCEVGWQLKQLKQLKTTWLQIKIKLQEKNQCLTYKITISQPPIYIFGIVMQHTIDQVIYIWYYISLFSFYMCLYLQVSLHSWWMPRQVHAIFLARFLEKVCHSLFPRTEKKYLHAKGMARIPISWFLLVCSLIISAYQTGFR